MSEPKEILREAIIQSRSGKYNEILREAIIQSRSGKYNARTKTTETLDGLLKRLRATGGYYAPSNGRYETIFVPFEEIEYLGEEWK